MISFTNIIKLCPFCRHLKMFAVCSEWGNLKENTFCTSLSLTRWCAPLCIIMTLTYKQDTVFVYFQLPFCFVSIVYPWLFIDCLYHHFWYVIWRKPDELSTELQIVLKWGWDGVAQALAKTHIACKAVPTYCMEVFTLERNLIQESLKYSY